MNNDQPSACGDEEVAMKGGSLSRRRFLAGAGLASLSGALGVGEGRAQGVGEGEGVYADLGVQPIINAAGTGQGCEPR